MPKNQHLLAHPVESKPPLPTGSAALDRLIGGHERACDGYPGGRIVLICIPQEHFNAIRTIVLRTFSGPATVVRSSLSDELPLNFEDPPPVEGAESKTPLDDPNVGLAQIWTAVSSETDPRLIVIDDVRFGTRGDDAMRHTVFTSAFLPKAKFRLFQRGHTLLAFSKIVPNYRAKDPEWAAMVSPVVAEGGKAWQFYSAVRIAIQFSDVAPHTLAATLSRNKITTTQGLSTLLAVRDGRIDDDATAKLLRSTLDIPLDVDAFDAALDREIPVPPPGDHVFMEAEELPEDIFE